MSRPITLRRVLPTLCRMCRIVIRNTMRSTQPSPWRRYVGAPLLGLALAAQPPSGARAPLTPESLSSFLRLSAGISAWKSYDGVHRWALRVAPSSGNLQTTELHLALPALGAPLSEPAVYHYEPERHALALRGRAPELGTGPLGQPGTFVVVLTSLCIREAWKYGERALRSCHLNLGHLAGALQAAAELHGWALEAGPPELRSEEALAALLGLPPAPARSTASEDETLEAPGPRGTGHRFPAVSN